MKKNTMKTVRIKLDVVPLGEEQYFNFLDIIFDAVDVDPFIFVSHGQHYVEYDVNDDVTQNDVLETFKGIQQKIPNLKVIEITFSPEQN